MALFQVKVMVGFISSKDNRRLILQQQRLHICIFYTISPSKSILPITSIVYYIMRISLNWIDSSWGSIIVKLTSSKNDVACITCLKYSYPIKYSIRFYDLLILILPNENNKRKIPFIFHWILDQLKVRNKWWKCN